MCEGRRGDEAGSHWDPDDRLRDSRLHTCVREKGLGTAAIPPESRRPSPSVQGPGRLLDPHKDAAGETLQVSETDKHHGLLEHTWT